MFNIAQLFFRYGAMCSSKSLQLLAVAHNYESQGKRIICFKPVADDRSDLIETRAGFSREAIVLEYGDTDIIKYVIGKRIDAILVDEAQFMSRSQIIAFSDVVDYYEIPVLAYGLKSDFKGNLFEGSEALLSFADKIEEIKTVCYFCNSKALMNMRVDEDGFAVFEGNQVEIGDTESSDRQYQYRSVCRKCYKKAQKGIVQIRK